MAFSLCQHLVVAVEGLLEWVQTAALGEVFTGKRMDPDSLLEAILHWGVQVSSGVPTVWQALPSSVFYAFFGTSFARFQWCGLWSKGHCS